MRIIDIEQGSPEWKEMRRTKIGASDMATLMVGSQKEVYDLYFEKFGENKFETAAMRRGSHMESEAKAWFEKEIGISFERPVGLHDEHDWMLASFDGLNFDLGISLEIKCPNEIPESLETWKSWKRYYYQVQAQLAVGGHERAFLLAYGPDQQIYTIIHRDEDAIKEIITKGIWFYDLMVKNTPPPEPIVVRDDPDAVEFAEAAKLLKAQIDELEEQWKILREGGIYLADEVSFECNGVKVQKIIPKPSVDYKAAIENLAPGADLSKFLKPAKPSWRITA